MFFVQPRYYWFDVKFKSFELTFLDFSAYSFARYFNQNAYQNIENKYSQRKLSEKQS